MRKPGEEGSGCVAGPAKLEALARMVARLCPDHRDPERFWSEKSELAVEIRRLARAWRAAA